jgi:hypothetical protein
MNLGNFSFFICVITILNDIIWELALKIVTAVVFINIPISVHFVRSNIHHPLRL